MKSKISSDSGDTWRRVIRVPVKADLYHRQFALSVWYILMHLLAPTGMPACRGTGLIPANVVSIALLLIIERFEVLSDHQIDRGRRRIREIIL